MNIKKEVLYDYYNALDFRFKHILKMRKHLDTIFVFGGAHQDNIRDKFLKYIKTNNETPFNFITIESLYQDIINYSSLKRGVASKKIELAKLELQAIENAYSILIFPESPGSWAELGFFSAKDETREKILIMNDSKYSHDESYINELITLIHQEKQINPFYFSHSDKHSDIHETFEKYMKQLMLRYTSKEEYFSDVYYNNDIENKQFFLLAIVYEIIRHIPYMSFTDIETLLRYILKQKRISLPTNKYLTSIISLLVTSELIKRINLQDTKYVFHVIDNEYNLFIYPQLSEKEEVEIMKIEMEMRKTKEVDYEF